MRRLLAALLVFALAGSGAALAGRGDPQKRIVPADQARARAMLLRTADVGLGFQARPTPAGDADVYCKALDESDLTLTGEARSMTFVAGLEAYTSYAQVYESKADSAASWRRGTSRAGEQCVRKVFGQAFGAGGGRLDSFGRISFPRLAEKSVAYRLVVSSQGVRAYLDVIGLKLGRAHGSLLFTSGLTPVPKAQQTRLARAVAARMAKAMSGA